MHDDYFTITRETVHPTSDAHENAVILLRGEFDLGAREDLHEALLAPVEAGDVTRITVDLGDVTFMDSEAINAIMDGYVAAEKAGIVFRLSRPDGIVKRVLEVLGLVPLVDADDPPESPLGS